MLNKNETEGEANINKIYYYFSNHYIHIKGSHTSNIKSRIHYTSVRQKPYIMTTKPYNTLISP